MTGYGRIGSGLVCFGRRDGARQGLTRFGGAVLGTAGPVG